jgi:hypothetical protein
VLLGGRRGRHRRRVRCRGCRWRVRRMGRGHGVLPKNIASQIALSTIDRQQPARLPRVEMFRHCTNVFTWPTGAGEPDWLSHSQLAGLPAKRATCARSAGLRCTPSKTSPRERRTATPPPRALSVNRGCQSPDRKDLEIDPKVFASATAALHPVVDRARPQGSEDGGDAASVIPVPSVESLESSTRSHILAALEKAGWVIDGPHGAAKTLAVHPNTLRSRMKKLGIVRAGNESQPS